MPRSPSIWSTPGRRGHAAVDRELYVPRSWTCDADRCRDAGLAEDTAFATEPELVTRMITRFLDAGHHAPWVAGDEVYGGNPKLRAALEERGTGYVLAVACSAEVTTPAGSSGRTPWPRGCRSGPGRSCPPERGRRDTASTTGPSSTWPTPAPAAASC
ncbi:transposase [Streptomyces ipomoeae]|uniref:transposase n=1 Tax=Streptomyces ipomoeae TaxID=103232 RepID=UPI0038D3880F